MAYRLLEPGDIKDRDILVVGGGDSAIESALLLCDQNNVTLSYRNDVFNRIKPKNGERIFEAASAGRINLEFNTNIVSIEKESVILDSAKTGEKHTYKNDLVYIFAGGELPVEFLQKAGVQITKKFGETVMKHN